MSAVQSLRFAVGGLAANKVRTALTMLGVLIGVAAVIMLVAVGNGSSQSVKDAIAKLGTNSLTVTSGASGRSGSGTGTGISTKPLTVADAKALTDRTLAPDIKQVAPEVSTSGEAAYQGVEHEVSQLVGTHPAYFEASDSKVETGGYFSQQDVLDARKVAVIGATTASDLFGTANPVGRTITVGGVPVRVLGVLAEKGSSGFQNADDVVVMPLTTVQNEYTGYGSVTQILIEATSSKTTTEAENEATGILRGQHGITGAESSDFTISDQASLLSASSRTDHTFTVLLGAVAAISLLVGGIGITNIMLVTVTERTREIGIRKAIGAPRSAILGQFLAESTLLSVLGGGLGVLVGLLASHVTVVGIHPVVVPSSVWGAFGVSVLIGLFFGGYPANRAAGLRPIEALWHE